MAQTIQIKRASVGGSSSPSSLANGELAYSAESEKLFIGKPGGATSDFQTIGGKLYTDRLSFSGDALTISTGSGTNNLTLAPTGNLVLSSATIDVSGQATEFKIVDATATAFTISEGSNNYITLDTTNSAEKIKLAKTVEIGGAYTLPIADGSNGQALITNGSGAVAFTTISTNLTIGADSGSNDTVSLISDTLAFTGGEGIDTTVSDNTITIAGEDATASNKGIASFSSADFSVSSGAVTIKAGGVSNTQLVNDHFTLATDGTGANFDIQLGDTWNFNEGEGIDITIGSDTITIAGEDASTSNKGIASFDSTDFTVSSGAVSVNAITLGSSALNPGATTTAINGMTLLDVDNLRLDGNTLSSLNTNGNIALSPNGSGVIDASTSRIVNVTNPSAAQDAATKAYVDAVKQTLDIKDAVKVATTANGTIGSAFANGQTVDGVTLATNDRILLKNQTDASENGIYVVNASGNPTRSDDANASNVAGTEVTTGMFVYVTHGTANAGNGFVLTTTGTITLDTTNLTFTQFSGAGAVTAGDGLTTGGSNIFAVNFDNKTLDTNSDVLRIKGITTTAIGDLLIGASGTNTGYTRLAKPSSDTAFLTMGTAGTASWTTSIDGGVF
tara:strand:+ start:1643 stop:3496 length:1854 start_codon:yes stop_codon:yes gene_type:complete